ncbi:MAG: metalloregulator ArsR/SmtB family transcription factor [Dehalococcoidia bacterium]
MTTDAVAAFADPSRRAILDRLAEGERAVGELVAGLAMSQPAVSQHLRVLLDAGLVAVRRDGRRRLYRARPEGLDEVRREVERYWSAAMAQMRHDLEGDPEGGRAPRDRRRR